MVEIAEGGQQPFGQRFGIPAPDGAIEQHFQQFVVRHSRRAALCESLAQALAVEFAMIFDKSIKARDTRRGPGPRIEFETGQALFLESGLSTGHAPRIRPEWLTARYSGR
jgi:hypothetical protein